MRWSTSKAGCTGTQGATLAGFRSTSLVPTRSSSILPRYPLQRSIDRFSHCWKNQILACETLTWRSDIIIHFRRGMWLFNWFKSTLESLGLMNKKAKIVFLGLDDAGKTTLLLRLKEDVMKQMDPTQQPHSQELVMGKITFKAWDLGGHEAARKIWKNYSADADGIVYLVDASNVKRLSESRRQLEGVMEDPALQKVPIVVLGNKIDKAGAIPENELREALGIPPKNDWNKSSRAIEVFPCSVAKKIGYTDAFKWLSSFIK